MKTREHSVAGGVVLNADGLALVLERTVMRAGKHVWEVRFPKGHIDPGETPEEAAVREVAEESGYAHVTILKDLGTFTSSYVYEGVQNERHEQYYLMRLTRKERSEPAPVHAEEALFTPRWMAPEALESAMTYASEKEFARRAVAAFLTGEF